MVWTLAFSIQHEVEKYGAYVAVASFLGLALLSILYFAQAREVRRLREWAGRAPERDAELEARVTSQARDARRAQPAARPAPAAEPTRVTAPAAAAAAASALPNGRATAPLSVPMGPRPATAAAAIAAATAALAPAQPAEAEAEGDAEAEPQAQPQGAVATDEVPAVAPVAPGGDDHDEDDDDDETGEEAAVAPAAGNGSGAASSIPRATPRPAPRAQPLRTGAGTRSAAVPPRRVAGRPAPAPAASGDGNRRGIILGVLAGIVVLAVAAVLIVTLTGGGSPSKPAPNRTAPASTGTPAASTPSGPTRAETEVVILNGTTTDGLAAKAKTTLTGVGYTADKVPTSTDPNQATPSSTVFYAKGRRRQAMAVSRALHIDRIAAIDPDTQTLADNSSNPAVKSDVVVVLGADQTP